MRPAELFPLFADITTLKGVGPAAGKTLEKLLRFSSLMPDKAAAGLPRIRDLLFHLPSDVLDRSYMPPILAAEAGRVATFKVLVLEHQGPPTHVRKGRRIPFRVRVTDGAGEMTLVFFHPDNSYIQKQLPVGSERVISGRLERFDGYLQMPHPDIITTPEKLSEVAGMEPVYPLTAGVSSRKLHQWILRALDNVPLLPEWLDEGYCKQEKLPAWKDALAQVHQPQNLSDLDLQHPARRRLACDEILASQLALGVVRSRNRAHAGSVIPDGHSALMKTVMASLPFRLTEGQKNILHTLREDMASGQRMLRLLQGDVGSGKTIVALLSMLPAIEAGMQCALMGPTEILARQHFHSIQAFVGVYGIKVELLTATTKGKEREHMLQRIANGESHIIIGTHALFQEKIQFHKLGYIVIDEQHRFGVSQRIALAEKGNRPHVLLMTATPIPRSLAMILYGDLDTSALMEKPAGRLPITTRAMPLERLDEVIEAMRRALKTQAKIYWICPFVEDSEHATLDIQAAEERYRELKAIFGDTVGMVHGKMKSADRQKVMLNFAGDVHSILVATTVIEVGIDVPEATIMIIENAERFGLSQLHQLRGRVGRSDAQSSCLLLYHPHCTDIARERLKVIREHTDGFLIAEEDLRLRGGGDVLGTRQSGSPDFIFADPYQHRDLVEAMRDDVKLILHRDPTLKTPRGKALRTLLYLYGHEEKIRFLESG